MLGQNLYLSLDTRKIRESHFRGENSWLFCQKGEGLENEGLDRGKGEEEEEKKEQTPKR